MAKMKEAVFFLCLFTILQVPSVSTQGNIPSSDGGTGLSQIDLEAFKEVTICTKQKKPLSCSYPGSNIAITNVFWGRRSGAICPSDDGDTVINCNTAPETEGIVKAKCEGKESCELEARHAVLQNPKTSHCPGVNKYLTVNYTCVPDDKEVVLCDSENSTLTCPASWKIGVNSVFWGRQLTSVCPAENGQTTCTGAIDSLDIVKKSCDGLPRCDIHASYDQVQNGAENCPGVSKYLVINYSCRPHPNIKTEEESDVKDILQGAEEQVKQFAHDTSPQDDDQSTQRNNEESVEKALKQLDGDQKTTAPPSTEGKEDLNIGRLGMGGLKALEKINNLIKASTEAQGGGESDIENSLTDDQAQTIERMIIEGIRNIKNKQTNTGTRKASIPRMAAPQKAPQIKIADTPKAPTNMHRTDDTGSSLKEKVKNTLNKLHDAKPLTIKAIIKSNNPPAPPPSTSQQFAKSSPVVRKIDIQRLPDIGGGLAGTGNEP